MAITVAIVDDESVARARLRRLLSAEPDISVIAECGDGPTAVDVILERAPDAVFLDVQMPGCDGFQVVRAIPESELPLIVFVTAYDAHALRAFDVSALDYLLKPFDAARLKRTLDRVRKRAEPGAERRQLLTAIDRLTEAQRRAERSSAAAAKPGTAAPRYRDRVLVRVDGRTRLIAVRDIDYVESAANYVRIHVQREALRLREGLSAFAGELDPAQFVRIHRRTIVNISRVKEIEPWFSGDAVLTLHDGRKLRLSRHHREEFQRALSGK
ncbi:MAG TPA: LytTR family DNA-binding domain-containing protein [Gemmatimonadaceae bacterium]|nr:LytTR family DNA-binding domain-containing protein [Gemmatimonadaceae bacterium]